MDLFDFFLSILILGLPAMAILFMVWHAPILLVLVFGTLAAVCFMAKGEGE